MTSDEHGILVVYGNRRVPDECNYQSKLAKAVVELVSKEFNVTGVAGSGDQKGKSRICVVR